MKFITRETRDKWIADLTDTTKVVAPVDSKGKLVYRQITAADEAEWNFEKISLPAKTWYFPMSEPILFIEHGKQIKLNEAPVSDPIVMFGVRPCDARSRMILDTLFLGKPPIDRQYADHRQSLTMVGLSCPQMWDSCFCTAVGGAPNTKEGLDILMTEIDDGYAVEVISDKGEKAFEGVDYEDKDLSLPETSIHEGLPVVRNSDEWGALFNEVYWKKISNSCLSCRACAFVCPTCRCYDVRDELVAIKPGLKSYERLRAWDTCTMAGYRRIAGGHNPRETTEKRLRNRFFCKFMYYPEDFGPIACIGCGRCIDVCPVGINILEVIEKVDQLLAAEPVNPQEKENMSSGSIKTYASLSSKDLDFILPNLATIIEMQDLADNIKLVKVQLDDAKVQDKFVFEPGQFAEVSVFGVGESPFGFAASHKKGEPIEFAVSRVGTVTDALFRLDVGDQIGIRGPLGNGFPMDLFKGKDILVLGGGIGGAPLRPIIQTIFTNRNDYGKVTILWAARTPGLLVFTEEYEAWKAQADVEMYITVDQAPEGWSHEEGLITTLIEKINPSMDNTITVTCGPPIMIKFTMMTLEKLGFSPDQNWVTLEAKMKCGMGKCGRCNLGEKFICIDGPVFCFSEVKNFLESFV